MDNYKILLFALSVSSNLYMAEASAKSETYYGCNSGYQFETKLKAARCIKQSRQSYKAPLACNQRNTKASFQLKVDQRGNTDLCVPKKNSSSKSSQKQIQEKFPQRLKGKRQISFIPKCSANYKLVIRKGKDACEKASPEDVKPPSKKVTR